MDLQIFNEEFFADNENVKKIEEIFKKNLNSRKTINSLPFIRNEKGIVTEIERLICKEFNFESCILYIPSFNLGDSAFTCAVNGNSIFDDLKGIDTKIMKRNNGYYFKDKRNKRCLIHLESTLLEECNEREIMAILLHEIGHNFNEIHIINKIFYKLFENVLVKLSKAYYTRWFIYCKEAESKRPEFLQKLERKIGLDISLTQDYITRLDIMKYHIMPVSETQFWFSLILGAIKTFGKRMINLGEDFKGESEADHFARVYGYADGIASFFSKKSTLKSKLVNSNFNYKSEDERILDTMERKFSRLISALLVNDCHSNNNTRVLESLKYIDTEIKNATDPRIKKLLIEEKKDILDSVDYFNKTMGTDVIKEDKIDKQKTKLANLVMGVSTLFDRAESEKK